MMRPSLADVRARRGIKKAAADTKIADLDADLARVQSQVQSEEPIEFQAP